MTAWIARPRHHATANDPTSVRAAQIAEARDLREEFYRGFDAGVAAKPKPVSKIVAGTLHGMTPAQRATHEESELIAALPVLRDIVAQVDRLRMAPVPLKREHLEPRTKEWRAIIEHWNNAIYDNKWLDIAPLCETCGATGFRTGFDQVNGQLTRHCGDNCKDAAKKAAAAERKKKAAKRAKAKPRRSAMPKVRRSKK